MAPKRANNEGAQKRRGRPPGSRTSQAASSRVAKPAVTKGSKTSKASKASKTGKAAKVSHASKSSTSNKSSKSNKPDKSAKSTTRKRSQLEDVQDELVEEQPNTQKKYVQLETKTRRIPQEQIDTWPHISPEVLEQIVAVIRDAKKDIVSTQRDERKAIAANNALNPLVRRLARQLSGSRVPPQAKDVHFNVDRLTDRNAHVFKEVTTARHSKQLLSEQTRVIQGLLRKDEDNLEQLKRNARKWKAEWKHQAKHGRVHPLLQDTNSTTPAGDGPEDIGLKRATPVTTGSLSRPDAALDPALGQLRRSLENLQGNHAQVKGVEGAMMDAQAALDDVLFRHASAEQYAAV